MTSTTGRLRGSFLRIGTALALAVFAVSLSAIPASAQARLNRNGNFDGKDKAERKAEKRAARMNRQQDTNGGAVVVDNGKVFDRSRVQVDPNVRRRNNSQQYTYRNGNYYDQHGNRVYDYRNSRVDPYASYPQYRRSNTYPNYGYNNSYPNYGYNNSYPNYGYNSGYPNYGYYNNGKGKEDRDDVARSAARNGYNAGFQRGQYDASQRNRPVPQGHGAYQFGYDGFDPSWGWASTYQQTYRQYFLRGYQDGYNRRGFNSRY